MTKMQFEPFIKKDLVKQLKNYFPNYKIQNGLGGLQVRTSSFTITGNVKIKTKPKKGTIITQTNLDMLFAFIIFVFPLGVYIFLKRKKQKLLEQEVVEGLKEILNN